MRTRGRKEGNNKAKRTVKEMEGIYTTNGYKKMRTDKRFELLWERGGTLLRCLRHIHFKKIETILISRERKRHEFKF